MTVNRFIVCLSALLVTNCGLSTGADEAPARPPELKVLDRLIGQWDTVVTMKPAEWTPKEMQTKGTLSREWVLNGRFVQEKGGEAKNPNLCLFTYDSQKKAYRFWLFNAAGNAMELTGQWDERSRTFTWKDELGNGITSSGPMRFVDADTIEWQAIAKDKDGKVYHHMEGKVTRKK